MHLLGEVFNEPVSETRIRAYWQALRDIPMSELVAAIKYTIRNNRFFPRPVDIREIIEGTPEVKQAEMLAEVQALVRRYGRYDTTGWRREASVGLLAAEDRFGWLAICGMNDQELQTRIVPFCLDEEKRLSLAEPEEAAEGEAR